MSPTDGAVLPAPGGRRVNDLLALDSLPLKLQFAQRVEENLDARNCFEAADHGQTKLIAKLISFAELVVCEPDSSSVPSHALYLGEKEFALDLNLEVIAIPKQPGVLKGAIREAGNRSIVMYEEQFCFVPGLL